VEQGSGGEKLFPRKASRKEAGPLYRYLLMRIESVYRSAGRTGSSLHKIAGKAGLGTAFLSIATLQA